MPSGGSIPGGDCLERPPSLALGEGARWHLPVEAATDLQPNLDNAIAEALKGLQHGP